MLSHFKEAFTTETPPFCQEAFTTDTPPFCQEAFTTETPPFCQEAFTTETPPFCQEAFTTETPPLLQLQQQCCSSSVVLAEMLSVAEIEEIGTDLLNREEQENQCNYEVLRDELTKFKSKGLVYYCPYCPFVIKGSQISQHILRHHNNILSLSCMMGGKSKGQLITEIKQHTDNILKKAVKELVECPICKKGYPFKLLKKHILRTHKTSARVAENLYPNTFGCQQKQDLLLEEARLSRKIMTRSGHDFEELTRMQEFLVDFSGGQLNIKTAKQRISHLQRILEACEITINDVLTKDGRKRITHFLGNVAENQSFSMLNGYVNSLSCLNRYMHAEHHDAEGLSGFANQMTFWLHSNGKEKHKNNASLRVKLDDTLMSNKDYASLTIVLDGLYSKACSALQVDALLPDVELYIAASFSFEGGNAHRSDIPSNATLAEFLAWDYISQSANEDKDFRVHEHKTAHMYSAGRVSITTRCEPLLRAYGAARAAKHPNVEMHSYAFSITANCNKNKRQLTLGKIDKEAIRLFENVSVKRFTNVWRKVRILYPCINHITNTQFRHFIETRNKENNNETEQRAVSDRLLHRSCVASQNYMATSAARVAKGTDLANQIKDAALRNSSDNVGKITKDAVKNASNTCCESKASNEHFLTVKLNNREKNCNLSIKSKRKAAFAATQMF